MIAIAYLDLHISTPDVSLSDFYDDELPRDVPDEFRREIEQAVAATVAGLLNIRPRDVTVESEWYEHRWPCPELVGVQHEDQCGRPTTRRHERYGRERGIYRVCDVDHKTPVDPIAQTEMAS